MEKLYLITHYFVFVCVYVFPEPQLFTAEQRQLLLKYFDEYGMTSTHRRNADLIQRCAQDVGTTVERVKVRSVDMI